MRRTVAEREVIKWKELYERRKFVYLSKWKANEIEEKEMAKKDIDKKDWRDILDCIDKRMYVWILDK